MSKSNLSHINELVSRIAREWCDIEEALKPYLDGQDLLSWISQQEKINPNNEINTDRILRTIAGMQCAVIYSRHRLADHLEGNFSSWEEFLKAVLNKTYEYGSILKFSSAKKLFKYHIDSSCFSNKWTTPLPHPDYEAGMQLGRNHVSGEPDFINFINENFKTKKGCNDPENESKGKVDLSSKDEMSQLIQNKKRELVQSDQNKKRELVQSDQIKEEYDRMIKIFVKRQWARLQPIKKLIDQLVMLIDSNHIKVRVDKDTYEGMGLKQIVIETRDSYWYVQWASYFEGKHEYDFKKRYVLRDDFNAIWLEEKNLWMIDDDGFTISSGGGCKYFEEGEEGIKYIREKIAESIALEQHQKKV